jgi:hypothetical protein
MRLQSAAALSFSVRDRITNSIMEITLELLSRLRGNSYVTTAAIIVGLIIFFYFNYSTQPFRGVPYVGGPKWDILNLKAQYRFVTDCKNLIKEGLEKVREQCQWT